MICVFDGLFHLFFSFFFGKEIYSTSAFRWELVQVISKSNFDVKGAVVLGFCRSRRVSGDPWVYLLCT